MKLIGISLLICFLSCQRSKKIIISEQQAVKPHKPDTAYLIDSTVIDGKMYTVIQGYPGRNTLPLRILFNGDTIYRHANYPDNGFDLKDLEGNGTTDIRLNYTSNVGGLKEWVVFDKETGSFREIKNFSKFPGTEKLEGTKYFYSDHSMGCAGGMWGSELFYINSFDAKSIARIFIITCRNADYTMGVTIYKIDGEKEQIIEQMVKMPEQYGNESDFFKDYWTKNYNKFR